MKKLICLVSAVAVLLSGCINPEMVKQEQQTSTPQETAEVTTTSDETSATEETTEPPAETIPDIVGQPVAGNKHLKRIGDAEIGTGFYYGIKCIGENLLINLSGNTQNLFLINAATGELVCSASLDDCDSDFSQIAGENIVLCDSYNGKVTVLDQKLQVVKEYSLEGDYGRWIVSEDLSALYKISVDKGIIKVRLEDGAETVILGKEYWPYYMNDCSGKVMICYIDPESLEYVNGILDLETGRLQKTAAKTDLSDFYYFNGTWLGHCCQDYNKIVIGNDLSQQCFYDDFNRYSLLPGSERGLIASFDNTESCILYETDGSYHSSFSMNGGSINSDLAYSSLYDGYFFIGTEKDTGISLYFLDSESDSDGNGLVCEPFEPFKAKAGSAVSSSLYERAAQISEKYGVTIKIADQCDTEYPYFVAELLTDEEAISRALTVLENTLKKYPKGFLGQLPFFHYHYIEIQLITGLASNGDGNYNDSYQAITNHGDDKYYIAMNGASACAEDYYHEFSHIIDSKLQWDAEHRDSALFSEERWLELCPDGFSYSGIYNDEWRDSEALNTFIDAYGQISSTEDRARIMEFAMAEDYYTVSRAGCLEKLDYYSRCIRDCFDTSGWPETTPWEKALKYEAEAA